MQSISARRKYILSISFLFVSRRRRRRCHPFICLRKSRFFLLRGANKSKTYTQEESIWRSAAARTTTTTLRRALMNANACAQYLIYAYILFCLLACDKYIWNTISVKRFFFLRLYLFYKKCSINNNLFLLTGHFTFSFCAYILKISYL